MLFVSSLKKKITKETIKIAWRSKSILTNIEKVASNYVFGVPINIVIWREKCFKAHS